MTFIEQPTDISFEIDEKTIQGKVSGTEEEWDFESENDYFKGIVGDTKLKKSEVYGKRYNMNQLVEKITTEVRKLLGN